MEIRQGIGYWRWLRLICCMTIFMLFACVNCFSQDTIKVYTVKDGKMYIWLSKKLPVAELDRFIKQYDLELLGLKQFIKSGNADSILHAGWEIGLDNTSSFTIYKPLLSSDEINSPGGRITFTSNELPLNERFPAVSNSVVFGYNRFRNKQPFAIQNSTVTFFLRNNVKAHKVMLAGSFNKWDPAVLSMSRTDSGWIAKVKLAPGKYWYKFIVDGGWMIDTDNGLSENDGQGNTNSVFYYTNEVFDLRGYSNAKKVFLAGSFNNWKEDGLAMEKTATGWTLPLYLAEGTYRYRFIVDHNWMTDPANPLRFPNEMNEFNSVISVGKPYIFRLNGFTNAAKVVLSGSFNDWRDYELLMNRTATGWEISYVLGPGNYEYKFIVDGKPIADPANQLSNSKTGNSPLILEPNYTFHLKGYENAKTIFLAGDFNDWNPQSFAMKKAGDEWVFRVHLSPGKHLYKFIVDGNWIIDPANKLWEQNQQRTRNSVIWVEQ